MRCAMLSTLLRLSVGFFLVTALAFGQEGDGLSLGNAEIQSASQLAFGPDGVLFVGDSLQGAVFAIDTADSTPAVSAVKHEIRGINQQIAALLGTSPDQILINDVQANSLSGNVYVAVSRGRGPDAIPVILRVDVSGSITEFSLNNVRYSMVRLADAAQSMPGLTRDTPEGRQNANPRVESITDISYVDGRVLVAGLSNEDFASDLRSIPFPFPGTVQGAGIRIWHSAHGRYETAAPVRTFVPYMIDNEQHILASYTCTPLVKIPVSALNPGAKVFGETIAELGNGNQPLDMLTYTKDGQEYILMSNTTRGVMKLATENLGSYEAITPPNPLCAEEPVSRADRWGPERAVCRGDIYGVPYETITDLEGVWQLTKLDDGHALVLADSSGSLSLVEGNVTAFAADPSGTMDLMTIPLP